MSQEQDGKSGAPEGTLNGNDDIKVKVEEPSDPKTEAAMKTIKDLDLFNMVLSLLERVSQGEVLPKDVYNEV
jgi:hypothetical protein